MSGISVDTGMISGAGVMATAATASPASLINFSGSATISVEAVWHPIKQMPIRIVIKRGNFITSFQKSSLAGEETSDLISAQVAILDSTFPLLSRNYQRKTEEIVTRRPFFDPYPPTCFNKKQF